jgi:tetratricopeptide (TPR) repeat protein
MTQVTIEQALEIAVQHHQACRMAEAEAIYRQILAAQPNHVDALHLLGVLMHQSGRSDGVPMIRRAVALNPNHVQALSNLGTLLKETGEIDEAIACCRRAIALQPNLTPAYNNLGAALNAADKRDEATAAFRQALALQPDYPDALDNLGGNLQGIGQIDEAIKLHRRAIALRPNFAQAYCNLGVALQTQEHLEEAKTVLRRAIQLQPTLADAHYNLGNVLAAQRNFEEAISCFSQAIKLRPDFGVAWNNQGNAFSDMGQPERAIVCHRRAIELRPDDPETFNNLCNSLSAVGQIEEAIVHCRRAIELRPQYAAAHSNLGKAISFLGQYEQAIAEQRIAILIKPDLAQAHLNLSLLLMLTGNWAEGWREFEWRWKMKDFPEATRQLVQPRWDGSDLAGKRILVHTEQGVGDVIQFIRYLPLVTARGGKVLLEVQPQLARLLTEQNNPDVTVLTRTGFDHLPAAEFDVHLPLMSLPLVLERFEPESAPDLPKPPYLRAPASLMERWRGLVGEERRLKVGLVWAGSATHKNDRNRSLPLAKLAPLVDGRVQFYSLQLGKPAEQAAKPPAGMNLIDLTAHIGDFADTAALMEQLDLLISVDTAPAHLAGAMGKAVWVLLPFSPDFRWQLGRVDSAWYPTMRLFRQTRPTDWDGPIGLLAGELATLTRR